MEKLNQNQKKRLQELERIIAYLQSNGITQHRQVLAKLVSTSLYHTNYSQKQRDDIWVSYNEMDAFLEELALMEGDREV